MIVERELWLKGRDQVDKLCHGEVAEWLNAAVSKTVTSVIPASGVRIPPSPRFGASQPISALRPSLVIRSASVVSAALLTSARKGAC
jgi:hypothetical protein